MYITEFICLCLERRLLHTYGIKYLFFFWNSTSIVKSDGETQGEMTAFMKRATLYLTIFMSRLVSFSCSTPLSSFTVLVSVT